MSTTERPGHGQPGAQEAQDAQAPKVDEAATPASDRKDARPGSPVDEYVARARAFAKEHPAAAAAIAAGTGVLVAAEFTIGAVAGIGAALFVGRKMGPERREELLRKSEELFDRTRAQGERAFHEGRAQAERLLRHGQRLFAGRPPRGNPGEGPPPTDPGEPPREG